MRMCAHMYTKPMAVFFVRQKKLGIDRIQEVCLCTATIQSATAWFYSVRPRC